MKYTKKLIGDRIGWIKAENKWSERCLQEYIDKAENISSHIKAKIEEMKELNEALKKLK